ANPQEQFAAVMTCDHADQNCPFVPGAERRFSLTYEDPKVADNTPSEKATYDERLRQIGRELLLAFSLVTTPAG
ncbi:MAG: protein-tyrosine-phosphatase, partial [Bacteroidota bacterium]